MNPAIFKAYDVRGVVPDELDARAALAIGRALAGFLGKPREVVVGRDMRESGIALREALVRGLLAEGVDVIDVGRCSTPMLYYATNALGAAGGAMITASHNPGRYNGFKLCAARAVPIGITSGLAEIRDRALPLADASPPPARGRVREAAVRDAYHEMLCQVFPRRPALRVVLDAGNGIAGEAIATLLDRLPLRTTRLYFEPDGSFPNHEADPLKLENLEDLRKQVRARGADLGVAFDGDGDRAVFVDEKGDPVPADLMMALLAQVALDEDLLGVRTGRIVVHDLRSSRAVAEVIREHGGTPLRSRVGHAFIKQTMRECGAHFGGELSGHYYFRFPAGYVADDGAAAMMLALQALDILARPLSELWRPLRRYAQSGEVNSRVGDVPAALERLRAAFPDGEADDLDGLTVHYPDWWFNVRPSNTEPLLRLNVEAATDEDVARHRDRVLEVIRAAP